jgi:hypothetical protein
MEKKKYYKFLDTNMKSYYDNNFYYQMPTFKNDKWIPTDWITEKNFEKSDNSCGKGLHLMKILNPRMVNYTGNCFEAEGKGLLGEDNYKARFKSIRLIRPISNNEIFKPRANLNSADLSYVNLYNADLRYTDLHSADLGYVNLRYANLSGADLSGADLRYANLFYADLRDVNLVYADLRGVNLFYADLRGVKNIKHALNLDKAYWNNYTQIDKKYKKLFSKKYLHKF